METASSTLRPTSSTQSDKQSRPFRGHSSKQDDAKSLSYTSDENVSKFFLELEAHQKSPLPEYLKNLIYLNGFACVGNFTAITEEELDRMEIMCRNEMPEYCPHTAEYFSFFSHSIQHFKIPRGHRIQLMRYVEDAKVAEGFSMQPKINQEFLQFPIESNSSDFPEIVTKIRRRIQEVAVRTNLTELCHADQLQIYVKWTGNEILGAVLCPTCGRDIKLNRDRRRMDKNGLPMISGSNFLAHFKKHLKNTAEKTTFEEFAEESEVEAKRRRSDEPEEVLHTTIKYEIEEY